jgi:hypothetical protein
MTPKKSHSVYFGTGRNGINVYKGHSVPQGILYLGLGVHNDTFL